MDEARAISVPHVSDSIERIHLTVDGATHALGPLERLDDLKRQVLAAIAHLGGFLDVNVDGGQHLSILITPASSITIAVATVRLDSGTADKNPTGRCPGDTGDFEDGDVPFDII